MTILVALTFLKVLVSTLHSFCSSYTIKDKGATVTVLTVFGFGQLWRFSVMTATPLNSNPPFPTC